jgi:hypothetical protein
MSIIIDGTGTISGVSATGLTSVQNLPATGTITNLTSTTANLTTATVTTLNAPSGVLATQNGMTGIAKAWVNFNGTAGTLTNSFNVSSITKNGTGDYTITFTTAMPNANYSWSGMATDTNAYNFNFPSVGARQVGNMTTTTLRIGTSYQQSASATDFSVVMVQVSGS